MGGRCARCVLMRAPYRINRSSCGAGAGRSLSGSRRPTPGRHAGGPGYGAARAVARSRAARWVACCNRGAPAPSTPFCSAGVIRGRAMGPQLRRPCSGAARCRAALQWRGPKTGSPNQAHTAVLRSARPRNLRRCRSREGAAAFAPVDRAHAPRARGACRVGRRALGAICTLHCRQHTTARVLCHVP